MIEEIWTGESAAHRASRSALLPFAALYSSAMAVRDELFDRGMLHVTPSPIAVVSVGNLTVGGTGKTPVSAWIAERLSQLGRKPAVVLRGYGDDEPMVHGRLNPGISVVVDRNRSRGIATAARAGADVAVLDDAFQHRGAARDLDIVLVSADDWTGHQHVLPAGPYRQSPASMRRASMVVITIKAAAARRVKQVESWIASIAPLVPIVVVRLRQSAIVRVLPPGARLSTTELNGKRVLAIAAVGNPQAFVAQLEMHGASVIPVLFGDHHAFTADDVRKSVALSRGTDFVICTLKDAVKLAQLWPATEPPLWYVSLSVELERGEASLDEMLRRLPGRERL